MAKHIDYITPIKEQLEENMHRVSQLYMVIGMGNNESPRWFNYHSIDYDTNEITIASTQRNALQFTVQSNFEPHDLDVSEFWEQFKAFRTEFLETYYPTIETY